MFAVDNGPRVTRVGKDQVYRLFGKQHDYDGVRSQDGSRAERYDQCIYVCQSSPGGSPVAMRFAEFLYNVH